MAQKIAYDVTTRQVMHVQGKPGPVTPTDWLPFPGNGLIWVWHQEPIRWSDGPSETWMLMWQNSAAVWVDMAVLPVAVVAAINQIDSAGDTARMLVVSKQTNTEEYRRAELQAREHAAAGYPADDVPSCVASWARAKWRQAWTSRDAADDIIATADSWYALLDGIRDLRLCAKEDVRHAADAVEVAARVGQFETDLSNLMKGIE